MGCLPISFHRTCFHLTCDESDPGFESAEVEDDRVGAGQHRQVEVDGRVSHPLPHQHEEGQDVAHRTQRDDDGQHVPHDGDSHFVLDPTGQKEMRHGSLCRAVIS